MGVCGLAIEGLVPTRANRFCPRSPGGPDRRVNPGAHGRRLYTPAVSQEDTEAGRPGRRPVAVDVSPLIRRIEADRFNGRHGYPPRSLRRAHLASYVMNIHRTNALIRHLQLDDGFRRLYSFKGKLIHSKTFNRVLTGSVVIRT